MKKFLPTIGFCLLAALTAQAQYSYNDYSHSDKTNVFYDDFSDNDYGWVTGTWEGCRTNSYRSGYYELKSSCDNQYANVNFNTGGGFYLDPSRNFEIESSMQFVSGEDNGANGLCWGQGSNQDDRFYFQFSGNSQYRIDKRYSGSWINIKPWTPSSIVRGYDYNKLTVRKVDDTYYFFINESLVHNCPFESFFGQQLKLQVNQNSTMRVDYIRISYLPDAAKDTDPPVITIYEPPANRGFNVVEAGKQLLIKGNASDASGIYEITVNGQEASVDGNGNFQKIVNLAYGDNPILVKATDTKNNTSTFSFSVNRKSEVVVNNENQVVVPATEKRLALVIGNAEYGSGHSLRNPVNDANLMASTLQGLGFDVIKKTDANKASMEMAIRDFSKKLPYYNVALFYYAGHGIQVDGLNYLIPTDAVLNEKNDCKFEAVSVNFVVEEFERYPNNVNIVILDACRNDPFRSWSRGGDQGFKAITPTSGTIISFATSEGSTSSDGSGSNGLFTEELVKQMMVPQPIESVFKKTRVQVQQRSNGGQNPQEWSQLTGDFFFSK